MHKLEYSLAIVAGCLLANGCAAPPPSPPVKPTAEVSEPQAEQAAPEAALKLVELHVAHHDPNVLIGKPTYTGGGEIVGIAGRVEGYTLVDGTRKHVVRPWRMMDADEIGYGTPSPVVEHWVLRHDQPWPDISKASLRVRAAVAERIGRIEIENFQPGMEQHAVAHGLRLTIRSRLGQAMGRHDATFLRPRITAEGQGQNADILAAWSLTPADRQAVDEASMRINYRTGFINENGLLRTPSGWSSRHGYHFLGQQYAGRTFGANVPVNVRIVDEVIDIEIPR